MRLLPLAALAFAGCVENKVSAVRLDAIAVVVGDFDNFRDVLVGLDVGSSPYDGLIVQETYMPEEERLARGWGGPPVEALLTDTEGDLDLASFNAVFVNSGTRGLGAVQYNNPLEPDDSLLTSQALQDACDFATGGGTLVVSDWAYDLVEYCWPDAIEFVNDDATPDAAQTGQPDGALLADVVDEGLAEDLGASVTLDYNYTAWAVIESVGADTTVLMTGNASWQPSASDPIEDLIGAPLLVRFPTGRSGQVLFSTFAFNVQTPALAEAVLLGGIEGLYRGAGSESASTTEGTTP